MKHAAKESTLGQEREEGAVEAEPVESVVREPAPEAGAVVAPAEAEEKPQVDELATLRRELERTKAKECEYLDGWQRARAELANARKRFQREQEQAFTNARADILRRLLPIVDDFERAFDRLPDSPSDAGANDAGITAADQSGQSWIAGIRLIQRSFLSLLEQEGVAPIVVVGQSFDPSIHEAVTHEPSTEVPEGFIIGEMRRGYKMGDRVLQPSMVRVSSGPPAKPKPETGVEPAAEGEAAGTEQS